MGWVEGMGYSVLKHAVDAFGVNTVLVFEDDLLLRRLSDDLAGGSMAGPWLLPPALSLRSGRPPFHHGAFLPQDGRWC